MKVLLINGYISEKDKEYLYSNTKGDFQFAAEVYQEKLIKGLKNRLGNNFYSLSAPFINPYPQGFKKIKYKGFQINNNEKYISFFNLWGIRNISRKNNLIKKSKFFLDINDDNKYVIVYSPHVPLLETAVYLKKKDPKIKIILLLSDLPQFISLSNNRRIIYSILKKYDIHKFYKLSKKFDSYILLTKYMNEFVNKEYKKKYIVIEGISNNEQLKNDNNLKNKKTIITYTGTLHKKFGVQFLVDTFTKIKDNNFQLNICGYGDSVDYIKNIALKDKRINYLGQITNKESLELQQKSNILINPRRNDMAFTKYSFPSKNMEYLATGIPVIAYKLDGIPDEYDDILFYPKDDSKEALKEKIIEVANLTEEEKQQLKKKTIKLLKNKDIEATADKIISFLEGV